jgi:cyclic beta-1,2-glucan synthetase
MENITLKNIEKNMAYITRYYKKLTTYTKFNKEVGSINEWIVDNYYLLSEQQQTITNELHSLKLLTVKINRKKKLNRLVRDFLEKENYRFNTNLFFKYLNEYQVNNDDYFTYDEIDYINVSIKNNIIIRLRDLVKVVKHKFYEKEKIDAAFRKIDYYISENKPYNVYDYIKVDKSIVHNNFYILEINYRLNKLSDKSEEVFKKMNDVLNEHNLSFKDAIKKEQEDRSYENMLMVNLFSSFKVAIRIKLEDLYAQINFTEKALIAEKAGIYDLMYEVSKIEYRRQIKKIVKKNRKRKEYSYVKELIDQANKDNKHIGFYLFKEPNYKLRSVLYVGFISIMTLVLSLVLSYYMGYLAFPLLLIPICGFMVEVVNQILLKKVDTKTLFRLKFEQELPEEYSTMVVIPTIIKNTRKIDDMFDKLELYYLSNRASNLYFNLLADVSSEEVASVPIDDEILEHGIKKADELNIKYGKKLFNFVYRNRFYNPGEGHFLGYERKRGALQHFNSLLLNTMSEADKKKYFKGHTFDDFKVKIKYVITIDEDTKLLLNTALKLIGTMAHPMNTPILSNDKRRVIKGHAIMQPRVSIDVEVTNKSEYSQLFAGLGGLDIYSSKHFDLYQDVFGEGSFIGKGIYDLEIFETILGNTFPENQILSHDLLEGNYLRCGYISDVELFDGFPSKYLNDAMRHHRWTRGDWQISRWLFSKVYNINKLKVSNPLNLISKWKIFDNLRRSLMSPMLFLLIIYGFSLSNLNPAKTVALVSFIIAVPIFFYLISQILGRQKYDILLKYYLNLIWGIFAVINKSFILFVLLPYEAVLYLDAIIRALYRMNISHKNMLNWIISADVDATAKNNLGTYIKKFRINYIMAVIIILLAYLFKDGYLYIAVATSISWLIAPFLMWHISRDIVHKNQPNSKRMESDFRLIAERTWKFFKDHLTSEYNYLIPDNYQENRNIKVDHRTSPTNIGYSLIAAVSAADLKIITVPCAIDTINNILGSVEKLPKWNGHLYNWYDTKTLKEMHPIFISTADSGNFTSALYVVKGFLEKTSKYQSLLYRVQKLIDNADFSKLYNEEAEVFSIGYQVHEGSLVPYNYNNFLSEARLASYIAIAKGDVPFKHWFRLDKTLTKYKWYKGIVSWTGTMFEYYMPLIFMKTYKHTLLDETYLFAYYAHKEFMKEVSPKLPWGITESAYNELDDAQNYKYKALGIPYLKFHDSELPQLVIAPYGSIMALERYPFDVYQNVKKLQALGMDGEYGLYESYDFEDDVPVKAYFSHHQGMILASITNYLKNNSIQNYFHSDKNIQAVEILLKEKVQVRTYIDLQIAKYKKYNYKRDVFENDIREQEGIMPIPEVGVLSNGFYSTFINDRGIGFSKYKNLQINRYRKVTDENHGIFMYLKDITNNKVWTNTYYPSCVKPDKYHVVFASDRIKYVREDDNIITTTEITVTKEHYAEIRKITIENNKEKEVYLELTSYGEVIMARPEEDVSHRVFNSITIDCEADLDTKSLIFSRSSRTKPNTRYFVVNRLFMDHDTDDFEFETSRLDFIGRNNNTFNPDKVLSSIKLSSNPKKLLDPIMSIRKHIHLKPNTKKTVYLLVGFAKSKDQVLEIVNTYNDKKTVDNAFEMATVLNNMRNRYANLTGRELRAYNTMLKFVYQSLPPSEKRKEILKNNILTQSSLWKYGISGDLPIIMVHIDTVDQVGFIKDILQAYEFYKSRAIYLDIVIYNDDQEAKQEEIDKYIQSILYRINNLNYFENSPGNIYIVKDLEEDEVTLLRTISKIYFDTALRRSLYDQIYDLNIGSALLIEHDNKGNVPVITSDHRTIFNNQYGGFVSDGKEYLIKTKDTPMPWSNVIANDKFGTVITNNFGGFTYSYNSREFKITKWSNDPVTDTPSEVIYINDERLVPSFVKHGFGYSTFTTNTLHYDLIVNVFVPTSDNVKIYDIDFKPKDNEEYRICFSINPVLGVTEEQSTRHILTDFIEDKNVIVMRNTYSSIFRNSIFMGSSEKIIDSEIHDVITKSIMINIKGNKRFTFMLGSDDNYEELSTKYSELSNVDKSFIEVNKYWDNKLGTIKVKTNDVSFDYMINGWYLYQVYASRLYSRAAFYQVGGATGFRDQLQDSMGLLYSDPSYTRKQILNHAKHQFKEGDVLHWWHEQLKFGARTRFSDDYLWLVYVTNEYLKVTNDFTILDEQVEFAEAPLLSVFDHEKGVNFTYSSDTASLKEHLKLCINKALRQMGRNNLPLMGSGDWNDGMNKVGHDGKGESVWVGFFLYDILLKMPFIISDDKEFHELCTTHAHNLKEALNDKAWDGHWYLRAFFDDGTPLGSHANKECQIDLISQAWSILTEIADDKRTKSIINEVEERLVDTDLGIIKLLDPAFKKEEKNPGYISDYLPGIRENGAQYTHAAMWYIMALVKLGKFDKAYKYYQMINPVNKDPDIYKVEPYVIAADIYSNPEFKGQGGWTWYTGSASWAYRIGIEEIIGVKKVNDTLVVKPNFNREWEKVELSYKYLTSVYNLTIYKDSDTQIIKLIDDGKVHNIIVGGK